MPTVLVTTAMVLASFAPTAVAQASENPGDANTDGDGSESEENGSLLSTPYLFTFGVFCAGIVALYFFYKFIMGGGAKKSSGPAGAASGNKGAYSPVSQKDGDVEMATNDGWDDWDEQQQKPPAPTQPPQTKAATSVGSTAASLFGFGGSSTATNGPPPGRGGRHPRKEKKKKPVVNMDDWDDDLDLGSADEDEEAQEDDDDDDDANEQDGLLSKSSSSSKPLTKPISSGNLSAPAAITNTGSSNRFNSSSSHGVSSGKLTGSLGLSGKSSATSLSSTSLGTQRSKSPGDGSGSGSGNNSLSNSRQGSSHGPGAAATSHQSNMDILYSGMAPDLLNEVSASSSSPPPMVGTLGRSPMTSSSGLGGLGMSSSSSSTLQASAKKPSKYQLPTDDVDLFAVSFD